MNGVFKIVLCEFCCHYLWDKINKQLQNGSDTGPRYVIYELVSVKKAIDFLTKYYGVR